MQLAMYMKQCYKPCIIQYNGFEMKTTVLDMFAYFCRLSFPFF